MSRAFQPRNLIIVYNDGEILDFIFYYFKLKVENFG